MSGTTVTGDDPYTTDSTGKHVSISYVLGLSFFFIAIIITISYISYKCTRSRTNTPSVTDGDGRPLTTGIDDDVLMTFPAFTYSEVMTTSSNKLSGSSSCSICLADYKQADVMRLLPDCGHLFHCKCVDTWLRVHPSCPMCRNSPSPVKLAVPRS